MDDLSIDARKQELLEARFLGLPKGAQAVQSGSESNMSASSSIGASTASDKETDSISGCPTTPEGTEKHDSKRGRKRKAEAGDLSRKQATSSNPKKINDYFESASPARTGYIQSDRPITSPPYHNQIRSSPSSRHSNSSNHIDISGLVHLQHKQNVVKESSTLRTNIVQVTVQALRTTFVLCEPGTITMSCSSALDIHFGFFFGQNEPSQQADYMFTPSFLSSNIVKIIQTDLTSERISQLLDATNGRQTEKNRRFDELQRVNAELEYRLKDTSSVAVKYQTHLERCLKVCRELLIEKARSEKAEARRKAMEGRLRLGQFTRQGAGYQDTWANGWAFTDLGEKKEKINREKEDIEKARKILNKRKPTAAAAARNKPNYSDDGSFVKPKEPKDLLSAQEFHERDEVLRQRMAAVKRDESELQFELERLERERSLHIRELKRISNEDNSKFSDHPVLNKQYLLLTLLGKGGFSEVYKGFDLEEQRYVAVKIHNLNREWNEQKKVDYARHANREAEIHRRVNHPRIVGLYDRFEVDINTFCTVMEFCGGNDLDFYLKQHRQMGEKEARTIIMQVVSALVYLNSLERPVIHYDLKPGNILLCNGSVCGDVKITDFGLSKQFDEGLSSHEGMDLTSQGAGTYWYLPPECFIRGPGGQPPKIDNKVDVWSVGVIFYQCLYGKKPFGHNLTQEAILKQNTILRATEVKFPNKPTVTNEAKSFIRQCLMYHKEDRADVTMLSEHLYLKPGKRGAGAAASPSHNGPAPI